MRVLLLIICALHISSAWASDSLVLHKRIAVKSRLFTTDPLGNIYLVKDNNALIRYNAKGDSIGFFNEVKKGKLTHIDATNPLRIILFFAEYGQVVILDNMLSLKSQFRLSKLGIINAPCVANSADGNIWVFDPATGMLLKVDEKPSIRFSTPLRNMLEFAIDPVFMIEQERTFFMVDSLEGIKKFDQFGFYNTSYPFQCKEMQYFANTIVFYKSPYLYSYNTAAFKEQKILMRSPETILQVRLERNFVYVLRKEELEIYKLPD